MSLDDFAISLFIATIPVFRLFEAIYNQGRVKKGIYQTSTELRQATRQAVIAFTISAFSTAIAIQAMYQRNSPLFWIILALATGLTGGISLWHRRVLKVMARLPIASRGEPDEP